jgi:hypothetical protein
MEKQTVRAKNSPTRCPYCHENIQLEQDSWLACEACLGRHHESCWAETSCCSSCQGTSALKGTDIHKAGQEFPVEAQAPPASSQSRSQLYQMLDANEHSMFSGTMGYVLSPLTLCLYPALNAEARFRKHLTSNEEALKNSTAAAKQDEELARRIAETRERATVTAKAASLARGKVFLGAFLACACMAMIGLGIEGGQSDFADFLSKIDLPYLFTAGSIVCWGLTNFICLAWYWSSVRQHEARQLAVGALERDLNPTRTKYLIDEQQRKWRKNGSWLAVTSMFMCLLWPLMPLWLAAAFRSPLNLHEMREEETEELFPQ